MERLLERLGSELRKRWVILRNPTADIRFEHGAFLGRGFSLHMPGGGTFIVGEGTRFGRRFRSEVGPQARILIGPGARVGNDVIISADTSIEFGRDCVIGDRLYMTDGSHRFRDLTKTFLEQGYDYQPLEIGDGAVIGPHCTVVHCIGAGAVVGAGSMVSKRIPAGARVAGVPAKPVA